MGGELVEIGCEGLYEGLKARTESELEKNLLNYFRIIEINQNQILKKIALL